MHLLDLIKFSPMLYQRRRALHVKGPPGLGKTQVFRNDIKALLEQTYGEEFGYIEKVVPTYDSPDVRGFLIPSKAADGTPSSFEILGTCPTQHFTRQTAPRPPQPDEPSELEYIASRVFGTRAPQAMERIRHGLAVLGAYTNEAGATVLTSGSTDWAHGLAGRDPQIEQITRNVLRRLG